jgi:hypothetical protein
MARMWHTILPLETGLVMRDVVRWLVERRGPQLVMAASTGDQEVTHTPPSAAASRAGVQIHGFHPTVAACLAPKSGRRGIAQVCA